MDPIAVWVRSGVEWAVIHRCRSCGEFCSNRMAADENPMLSLSAPPFPLHTLETFDK